MGYVNPWQERAIKRIWGYITDYSLMLIGGALIALLWANTAPDSYGWIRHLALWSDGLIGALETRDGVTQRVVTLPFVVNDLLMAIFFAVAAKEVWEAVVLSDGPLRGRKALTPLIATAGGMGGPVVVYLGLALLLGVFEDVQHGWAVPTATDIAFSYLVGRIVFGAGHPAIRFLLLLAIADDAGGLVILALFYPTAAVVPAWLLVSLVAALVVYLLANVLPRRLDRGRRGQPHCTWVRNRLGLWPWVLAGAVSWYAFQMAGLHPALGLLPIIPTIPHAERDFGIFADPERATDLLNRFEQLVRVPVQFILFGFGLLNAGVQFSAISEPTLLVLLGLLIGKPLGIALFGWLAAFPLRLGLPEGMVVRDLLVVGCVAAIGFTVALFVASVAFPAGPVQDAAKMGALLSLGSAGLAIAAGRAARIHRIN